MKLTGLDIALIFVPFFMIFIGGPVVIVQRIRHRRKGGKAEPGLRDAGKSASHRALLSSVAGVLLFLIAFGSLRLFVLTYWSIFGADDPILPGQRIAAAGLALPVLGLAVICWMVGLVYILKLLFHHPVLRRGPEAVISYILEMVVPVLILVFL